MTWLLHAPTPPRPLGIGSISSLQTVEQVHAALPPRFPQQQPPQCRRRPQRQRQPQRLITAALPPDPGNGGGGDERVQEGLVDMVSLQIGQQHVKDFFLDESEKLRRTAEEVLFLQGP